MVPVGDIGARELSELAHVVRGVVDHPDRVGHAVASIEVEQRAAVRVTLDEPVDLGAVAVGQEHRAGVGLEREDVTRPVVLLVASRLLVLADQVVAIVVDVAAADHADLRAVIHHEAVEVHPGAVLADQCALLEERVEGLASLGVDPVVVDVGALRQVDLGADHAQES